MLDFDCGKWSEVDDVRLPDIILGDIAVYIVYKSLGVTLTFDDWSIWAEISERTENQEIHLLMCLEHNLEGLCEVSKRKTVLFSLDRLSRRLFR